MLSHLAGVDDAPHALTTCRRVIASFVDAVFRPQEEPFAIGSQTMAVGEAQTLNRLRAYIYERIGQSSHAIGGESTSRKDVPSRPIDHAERAIIALGIGAEEFNRARHVVLWHAQVQYLCLRAGLEGL